MEKNSYNTGNYDKHMTKNKLKKVMVNKLNEKIIDSILDVKTKSNLESINILDVGCGEGFISRLVKDRIPDNEIVGVEYSIEALEIARKLNPDITFYQGDIYNLDFKDDAFDLVICTEVLEHLQKPEKAIKEIIRVASKGVIITVPNEPWFCLGNLLVLKNVKRLGNPKDHINHWTAFNFRKFILSAGAEFIFLFGKSFPWNIAVGMKEYNE